MNNFFNFQHRLYPWNWKLQNSGFSTLPQGRGMYADNQGKILSDDPTKIFHQGTGATYVGSGVKVEPVTPGVKKEDTGSIVSEWLDKSGANQKELMKEYMQQAGKLQAQNRIYSNFNNFAQSFGKGEMLKADAYANMSNRMANVTNSIKYTGAGTRPVIFPSFRYF
jgi:hypothetical protein